MVSDRPGSAGGVFALWSQLRLADPSHSPPESDAANGANRLALTLKQCLRVIHLNQQVFTGLVEL